MKTFNFKQGGSRHAFSKNNNNKLVQLVNSLRKEIQCIRAILENTRLPLLRNNEEVDTHQQQGHSRECYYKNDRFECYGNQYPVGHVMFQRAQDHGRLLKIQHHKHLSRRSGKKKIRDNLRARLHKIKTEACHESKLVKPRPQESPLLVEKQVQRLEPECRNPPEEHASSTTQKLQEIINLRDREIFDEEVLDKEEEEIINTKRLEMANQIETDQPIVLAEPKETNTQQDQIIQLGNDKQTTAGIRGGRAGEGPVNQEPNKVSDLEYELNKLENIKQQKSETILSLRNYLDNFAKKEERKYQDSRMKFDPAIDFRTKPKLEEMNRQQKQLNRINEQINKLKKEIQKQTNKNGMAQQLPRDENPELAGLTGKDRKKMKKKLKKENKV